jgi:hypothetical protein
MNSFKASRLHHTRAVYKDRTNRLTGGALLIAALINLRGCIIYVELTSVGVPDRIRTYDLRLRKPTLYPAELRVQTGDAQEMQQG